MPNCIGSAGPFSKLKRHEIEVRFDGGDVSSDAEAMAFAQRLASGPSVALGHMRRLMRASFDRGLRSQLEAESAAFRHCAGSVDFKASIDAFFAKRRPVLTGR